MPLASVIGRTSAPYALAIAKAGDSPVPLTLSERRECERLPHDEWRRDWLAARGAAKRAIAEWCGIPLDRIRLDSRAGAAPRCFVLDELDCWSFLPLSLSIAHRDGVGIAAVAEHGASVGVDVERGGDIGPAEYRYFLAPGETAVARRLGATLLWVLKEAVWKALGLALSTSFASVTLDFDTASDDLRSVSVGGTRMSARARVVSVPDRSDLVAAAIEIDPEGP
jgi:phosphopantetheinyl transferase